MAYLMAYLPEKKSVSQTLQNAGHQYENSGKFGFSFEVMRLATQIYQKPLYDLEIKIRNHSFQIFHFCDTIAKTSYIF